ncbi:DUF2937 family protein [Salipiger sp.]|uniref:DUF2937 family protein n=1 Tax=Salipiger sp. TaxID=2078585 RepID=UPI003A97205E
MFAKTLALAAGLTGAAGLSQFPEFSQQYVQRLGGTVDELARSLAEFDRDAAGLGLDRAEALRQLATGGDFGAARADTMGDTIRRHDRLAADLAALTGAGALERVRLATHLTDPDLVQRTWQSYRPAVPVTPEGAAFAGTGFVGGWFVVSLLLSVLAMPFARGGRSSAAARREPTFERVSRGRREPTLRATRGSAPSRAGARLPRDI